MNFIDAITYYRVGTLRYAVRESGRRDGTPIWLLHGLRDNGAGFSRLVDRIEARRPGRFRFIAPDWRGHGDSTHLQASYWFPDYLADLDSLIAQLHDGDAETRPVVLVGHSMGGQIASQYAGVRPSRVSHLITLDSLNVPGHDIEDTPRRYRRWLDAQRNPPTPRHHADVETISRRIGRYYPELDETSRHFLAEQWSQPAGDGTRRMRVDPWHDVPFPYGFRADESMALWRQVSAEVLCIEAADSPLTQRMQAELADRRACFAHMRRVEIPDCGHMLHLQRPDAIAREIVDFL